MVCAEYDDKRHEAMYAFTTRTTPLSFPRTVREPHPVTGIGKRETQGGTRIGNVTKMLFLTLS